MSRSRLFGTDGIRGTAAQWPLTAEFVLQLGRAIAEVWREAGHAPLVVVGRDTRRSGAMLESAIGAGLMEGGLDLLPLGIIPTPAVAYLARYVGAGLGVVISASHNPSSDNGIKLLSGTGFKLSPAVEQEIERRVEQLSAEGLPAPPRTGQVVAAEHPPEQVYVEELLSRAGRPAPLTNWHLLVDCAHGATSRVAPELFRRLGARVTVLHADPDGDNINQDSGSEHPQALREQVLRLKADGGIAFDGDGDRVLLVDERGRLLDGDDILYVLSQDLHEQGRLRHGRVVGTVMTNLGLEQALSRLGVQLERVPVGDRHVAQRMLEGELVLGGESSGHVILFGEGSTTGDGLYTAMKVLGVAVRRKRILSALTSGLTKFPQVMVNVPVADTPPLDTIPEVKQAQAVVANRLGGKGRFLLRYSGTQPLVRVMVECEDRDLAGWAAQLLVEAVQRGVPRPKSD